MTAPSKRLPFEPGGRTPPTCTICTGGASSRSSASARRRTSRSRRASTALRIDVDDQQRLLEADCACDDPAFVVEHARMPVEDQLVLSADGVAEGDEARVVASARDEHLLALDLLPHVERRSREIHE